MTEKKKPDEETKANKPVRYSLRNKTKKTNEKPVFCAIPVLRREELLRYGEDGLEKYIEENAVYYTIEEE